MPTNKPEVVLPELARRAIPFLRDEGANYEDDGSNEPLELAREIEAALAADTLTRPADGESSAPACDRASTFRQANLLAACFRLKDLVEGVGCHRWVNASGLRLKDTPEWFEFYCRVNESPLSSGSADGDFVMVPREPTRVMLDAAFSVSLDTPDWMRLRYQAMLSAAPQQPGQEVGEVERLRGQMEIVWRYLQKVSPWSASNDMLWCDEIMVGIDLLAQQVSQPQQPAEAVAAIPSASTIASAVWRDWMTNEQADRLGDELHAWMLAHASHSMRPTDDRLWDQTLRERDTYHDVADRLATIIADITGVDIGEHSSANCPWDNAIEAAESYAPPAIDIDIGKLRAENERLNAIINTPQADDFLRAVSIEAEHQRQRWGNSHDAGKEPADWFWLIGYLAGKALHAQILGNIEKAEHHVITTAAACANWHRAMFGRTDMRPGIDGETALIGDGGRAQA